MPLKYGTETVLVILLGIVTLAGGVLLDTLPLLPRGLLPWGAVFGLTLLYPLLLFPLFRRDRADYAFRILHLAPLVMVIGWMVTQLLTLQFPGALALRDAYTWSGSIVPVAVIFVLIALFCIHVLRRRVVRIGVLLFLLLVPFAVAATIGGYREADRKLSAALWRGRWWDVSLWRGIPSGTIALVGTGVNLEESSGPREGEWREKLRALDARLRGATGATLVSPRQQPPPPMKPPPRLPSAGNGAGMLAVLVLAGYCCTLHRRVRLLLRPYRT